MQYFLLAVFTALAVNFLAAVVFVLHRARRGSWLLLLLLSSTTGAALAVMGALLFVEPDESSIDVALVFTALASVSALVAVVVFARRAGAQRSEVGERDAL